MWFETSPSSQLYRAIREVSNSSQCSLALEFVHSTGDLLDNLAQTFVTILQLIDQHLLHTSTSSSNSYLGITELTWQILHFLIERKDLLEITDRLALCEGIVHQWREEWLLLRGVAFLDKQLIHQRQHVLAQWLKVRQWYIISPIRWISQVHLFHINIDFRSHTEARSQIHFHKFCLQFISQQNISRVSQAIDRATKTYQTQAIQSN